MARRKMPAQNPGESKQDFETPADFMAAMEARFGKMDVDLSCRTDNAKAPFGYYFDQGVDGLEQNWALDFPDGNLWLNPEFGDIGPWARKCALEARFMKRGRIFLLTPASIGSNWFARYVKGHAQVEGLSPRLKFVGAEQGYPKDLSLSIYGQGHDGFGTWRWKV